MNETSTQLNGYVAICNYLESRMAVSADLTKYAQADVVKMRPNELAERRAQYAEFRQRLADFLGIPMYPMGHPTHSGYSLSGTSLV